MADLFDQERRSELMSLIRSSGNKMTELRLIQLMKEADIHGWRRHYQLLGHPDFVFRRERIAVFVDGCFWHYCPKCGRLPSTNRKFWKAKLERNRSRDKRITRQLRRMGWSVLRFWEHELNKRNTASVTNKLKRYLSY